jgi:hypothetical protein
MVTAPFLGPALFGTLVTAQFERCVAAYVEFLSPPITPQVQPYLGRRAACRRGAGGELVELIERL